MAEVSYTLRPVDPQLDAAQLAALYSTWETEPTTEAGFIKWYERESQRPFRMTAAERQSGQILGVYSLFYRGDPADSYFDTSLLVAQDQRCRGLGGDLYADLLLAAQELGARKLYGTVRDDDPASLRFAEKRDFTQRAHGIEMRLDLADFDFAYYEPFIAALQSQGFIFTSMAELGNTEDNQRKLYELNNTTSMTTPGTDGRASWENFADFQQSICQSSWYHPEGQMVVIDSHTGAWVAMSAITVFDGSDAAYNLFTGVDVAYRGRKLAQAVKALALRYARQVLGATQVRTNHNAKNTPMLAIDEKLGYVRIPGMYGMVKDL